MEIWKSLSGRRKSAIVIPLTSIDPDNSETSEGSDRHSSQYYNPGEDGNPSVNVPGMEDIAAKKSKKKDKKRETIAKKQNDREERRSQDNENSPLDPRASSKQPRKSKGLASSPVDNGENTPAPLSSPKGTRGPR